MSDGYREICTLREQVSAGKSSRRHVQSYRVVEYANSTIVVDLDDGRVCLKRSEKAVCRNWKVMRISADSLAYLPCVYWHRIAGANEETNE